MIEHGSSRWSFAPQYTLILAEIVCGFAFIERSQYNHGMPKHYEHEPTILDRLDQYDTCRLECDGLTRVLSYVLSQEAIDHTVMLGEITDQKTQQAFSPHFWIALPDGRYIDYRARIWLGQAEHVPHGIFNPADYAITYTGEAIQFDNLAQIAPLLMQLDCDDSLA